MDFSTISIDNNYIIARSRLDRDSITILTTYIHHFFQIYAFINHHQASHYITALFIDSSSPLGPCPILDILRLLKIRNRCRSHSNPRGKTRRGRRRGSVWRSSPASRGRGGGDRSRPCPPSWPWRGRCGGPWKRGRVKFGITSFVGTIPALEMIIWKRKLRPLNN